MKLENQQTLRFIKDRIKSAYKHRAIPAYPICVVGHQGIGKSAMVKQAATELSNETGHKVDCRVVAFHVMEPTDILGLPEKQDGKTIYLKPEWFPEEGDGTYGILFIDEINRIERDVLSAFYTLITNREVNGRKLSSNWIVVAACNPSEDAGDGATYDVAEMDSALEGRFRIFGVTRDIEGYMDWFAGAYSATNPIFQFMVADPAVVSFSGNRGTPRDYESLAMSFEQEGGFDRLGKGEMLGISAACIGFELANSFVSFQQLRSYCTPDMILFGDWNSCEVGLKAAKEQKRFDIEMATMRGVTDLFLRTEHENKLNYENVMKFLEVIKAEKSIQALQMMINTYSQTGNAEYNKRINKLIDLIKEKKSPIRDWAKKVRELSENFAKEETTKKSKKAA